MSKNKKTRSQTYKVSPSNNYDRRTVGRYRTNVPIELKLQLRELRCQSVNISPTGVRVVAQDALRENSAVKLKFALDDQVYVQIKGRVVWQQAIGIRKCHVVGLAFEGDKGRRKIRDWLKGRENVA